MFIFIFHLNEGQNTLLKIKILSKHTPANKRWQLDSFSFE
jgi:hypothetical protein